MIRGDVYLLARPDGDPRSQRPMVVVSRQLLLDISHGTVICAPIGSASRGLATEVPVGTAEGLKSESSIHCDDLRAVEKRRLTNFIGRLNDLKLAQLDRALAVALGIDHAIRPYADV